MQMYSHLHSLVNQNLNVKKHTLSPDTCSPILSPISIMKRQQS